MMTANGPKEARRIEGRWLDGSRRSKVTSQPVVGGIALLAGCQGHAGHVLMARLEFVTDDGKSQVVEIKYGVSVQEAAIQNGIDGIDAICGGACSCSTCHVYVLEEWATLVGPPGELENELLEMVPWRKENSRLSCQIEMNEDLDGLTVILPSKQVDVS
jgi:2Fe-2S ferredoxin